MNLVTVEEARIHLEIDTDAHDDWLATWIPAASAMVRNYMKSASLYLQDEDSSGEPLFDTNGDPVYVIDTSGEPVVRFEVQAATKILLGYLFRQRDEDESREFEPGYLPRPVTAILYPLRMPAVE